MEPLVSIVLPIREVSKDIIYALDSIYGQSIDNFELIVVVTNINGYIETLQKKYNFNLFICDKGKNASRNYGSDMAKGRYLLFLDDDMVLEKDILEKCLSLANAKEVQAVTIPERVRFERGLLNKVASLEKKIAHLDSQIESPRFIEKKLYYEVGKINDDLDPIDDGDLKAKLEEKGVPYFAIDSYISLLSGNRLLSLKRRMLHMYMRGKKMPLFNELHPQSNQLKFMKRGKQYLTNYKHFFTNPISFSILVFLKIGDFILMRAGSLNTSESDKKKISDIRNKRIFEKEAGTYQEEFFEDTIGAKYVDKAEKEVVKGYLKNIKRDSHIKILDIGPGGGRWSEMMLVYFPQAEVIGCDLSEGMVLDLNNKFQNEPRFKAVTGNMQKLPFNNDEFDLVISIRAIKYAQDQGKVLKEINRVLKSSSYAIIELPYLNIVYRMIRALKIFGKLSEYANRINLMRQDEIIRNAESADLKVLNSSIQFTVPATFYKDTNNVFLLKMMNMTDYVLPRKVLGRSLFLKLHS